MSTKQSGDVLLQIAGPLSEANPGVTAGATLPFLTFNIQLVNGLMDMTESFETAVGLSLFGGNFDDNGSTATQPQTWWANLIEQNPAARYVSRTQNIIQGLPATSSNLVLLDEAVLLDLQWFLDLNIASSVSSASSIPQLNRVDIAVGIRAIGREEDFAFTSTWKASV